MHSRPSSAPTAASRWFGSSKPATPRWSSPARGSRSIVCRMLYAATRLGFALGLVRLRPRVPLQIQAFADVALKVSPRAPPAGAPRTSGRGSRVQRWCSGPHGRRSLALGLAPANQARGQRRGPAGLPRGATMQLARPRRPPSSRIPSRTSPRTSWRSFSRSASQRGSDAGTRWATLWRRRSALVMPQDGRHDDGAAMAGAARGVVPGGHLRRRRPFGLRGQRTERRHSRTRAVRCRGKM